MVVKSQFCNSALIHFMFIHSLLCMDFMWVCFVYKELRYVFESNIALWNVFHFLWKQMIQLYYFTLIGAVVIHAHKY